ncbi:8038_t:CDS:1 [Dentiscutata erythropus]|uniref:8038_t:CDS:1 n=1 Tax=Dentiscutata erythropus TaxID=1348616 RepID=A0A9N9IEA6_9GLOM|nr:8038_t:CDS:1 [Dentiscutata erythropus]
MFVNTLVEEKIPVKASIDTTSKSNTISKSLFDKFEEDYGLECLSGDELIGEEIKGLDLQFCYKGKWRSLDGTEVIDFQIHKNPSFDLVLGRDWLWIHKAKIGFGFSSEINDLYAKIVIDGMSIPLIDEDFNRFEEPLLCNKAGSSKNNPHKSDLSMEEITNIIKKILSDVEDNQSGSSDSHKSQQCRISSHQKRKDMERPRLSKAL